MNGSHERKVSESCLFFIVQWVTAYLQEQTEHALETLFPESTPALPLAHVCVGVFSWFTWRRECMVTQEEPLTISQSVPLNQWDPESTQCSQTVEPIQKKHHFCFLYMLQSRRNLILGSKPRIEKASSIPYFTISWLAILLSSIRPVLSLFYLSSFIDTLKSRDFLVFRVSASVCGHRDDAVMKNVPISNWWCDFSTPPMLLS